MQRTAGVAIKKKKVEAATHRLSDGTLLNIHAKLQKRQTGQVQEIISVYREVQAS